MFVAVEKKTNIPVLRGSEGGRPAGAVQGRVQAGTRQQLGVEENRTGGEEPGELSRHHWVTPHWVYRDTRHTHLSISTVTLQLDADVSHNIISAVLPLPAQVHTFRMWVIMYKTENSYYNKNVLIKKCHRCAGAALILLTMIYSAACVKETP